jgi:succinylglutamate desuccinylase
MTRDRVIGRFSMARPGPMLVILAAMHGNEPVGVLAVENLLRLLHEEVEKNPDFVFAGSVIGIIANKDAFEKGVRYINQDLNRLWSIDHYYEIKDLSAAERTSEQTQIIEVIEAMREEINLTHPQQMVVLDIHTTSAHGGIFTLITEDPLSEQMAVELHAPVIKGMLNGIKGTSIHFFHGNNMGIPTTAIGFEAGQHEDPQSVLIATSAIINCMRTIGNVNAKDVENKHDILLQDFSKNLPKVSTYRSKYIIKDRAQFHMLPGFKSFDKVHKGQHLANDGTIPVHCEEDAYILMPLYQAQGSEGYYLIR